MANLHYTKAVAAENKTTQLFLAVVCLIVFLLWLAGLIFLEPNPYSLYIFVGIAVAITALGAGNSARGPKAAVKGSTEDVDFLSALPESFQIFMNVNISVRSTLDAVIVGPNGLFVVDVKTRTGKIEPMGGSDWIRHKVGSKGTPYRVPMKNPVQQMNRSIRELQSYLAFYGIRPWIEGCVYFTRAEFEEQVEGCYTSGDDVLHHIQNFTKDEPLPPETQEKAIEALTAKL